MKSKELGQRNLDSHNRLCVFRDLIHHRWINSLDVDEATTSLGSVLVVEFTPTDLGKDHLWNVIEKIIGYINDVRDVNL